jgi:hypothetical protein
MMGKILVVCCLLLVSGTAFAQTPPAAQSTADTSGLNSTLLVGAGVVAGVVAADLLTGGTLTGPLFGLSRQAAGPMFTAAQTREATASGALIGEAIAPATARQDNIARAEMLRVLALAAGGIAGWIGVNQLTAP